MATAIHIELDALCMLALCVIVWQSVRNVNQQMRIIRFRRKNQKDVVLANWQCHPHRTGGSKKYDISSDIIGVMREKTEKKLDVNFLYLQGGAGNINPVSRISGEARFSDYRDIGKELAQIFFGIIPDLSRIHADRTQG